MTDETNDDGVVVKTLSLTPLHWATVDSHAKDMGMTRSAAVRHIIDQWTKRNQDDDAIARKFSVLLDRMQEYDQRA